jgi:hypothetical protein
MSYRGDLRLGDTIDIKFATVSTTGAPTTLAGSPVISAYPANSTTQITAGITLTVDFDAVTGLHNVRVVASSGNGYATATNYDLVITAGTVGGTSVVGYVIGSFSIENRSALMPTTAARTLVVDAAGLADANMVKAGATGAGTAQTARDLGASVLLSAGTGTGQIDFTSGVVKANLAQILATALTETAGQLAGGFKKFFNIAAPASTMDALTLVATATNLTNAPTAGDLTATMKASVTTAATAATPTAAAVTGNVGGNVTGSVGSVAGAVASVTGNVGGNVTGSVGSIASGGIARASFAAETGLQSIRSNTAQAGSGTSITLDASASAVTDFYKNALVVITGGTGVGQGRFCTAYNGSTKVATVTAWATNPDNTSTFAVIAFDAIVGATAPTAAQNATAVWQDLLAGSDFSTASSIGKLLKDDIDAAISTRASQTSLDTLDDYVDTEVAAIKAKTDQLVFTVANQIDANVLDWKSATAPAMTGDAFARLGAPAGASVSADVAAVKADTAAVKTKTDQITFTTANKVDSTIQIAGDFAQAAADKVWSTTTRSLTDKIGFALSSAGVQAIWDALTSALTAVSSIGKLLVDNINATISSRSTYAGGAVASVTGNVGGNVVGSVASVTAGVSVATGGIAAASFAAGAIDSAAIATDAIGAAELAAGAANKVRDAVWAQTMAELAAVPGVTDSTLAALEWLFLLSRNKVTQTATTQLLRNDADGATVGSSTVSDDGTTFTRGKFT